MIRLSPVLIILVLAGLAGPVTAAPVRVSSKDFQSLGDELVALATGHDEEPETPNLPPLAVIRWLRATAWSTSSTSTSQSLTAGSGSAAAALLSSLLPSPPLIATDFQLDDRLLIPLRILDGVFRPPESCVSL